MSLIESITVKNLDHLGIVAGLIDEIGIVELINQKLGVDTSYAHLDSTSFHLHGEYNNIAILFYLWQKSYCFLGQKQQVTVNR